MAFEAILDEVDQLNSVSARLEGLAENHPPALEALLTIAGKCAWRGNCLSRSGSDEDARR